MIAGPELVIVVVLFAIGIGLVVLAARSQPRPAGRLAALFFTMTEHGTIAVIDEVSPGRVTFGGQFSNAAVDAVNQHLPG